MTPAGASTNLTSRIDGMTRHIPDSFFFIIIAIFRNSNQFYLTLFWSWCYSLEHFATFFLLVRSLLSFLSCFCFVLFYFVFMISLELCRCSSDDLFLSSRPRTGLATTYINVKKTTKNVLTFFPP